MKLSTKSRYALEGLMHIAMAGPGPVSTRETAEATGIDTAYLEQIFIKLKKAGMLVSSRGAKGGCLLGIPAAEITVGAVIRAADGSLVPVKCAEDPSVCTSKAHETCPTRRLWEEVSHAIGSTADSITLEDLVNDYRAEGGH